MTSLTSASVTEADFEEQLLGSEHDGEVIAGAFERASGGTLVIDELSDLNEAAQRVLVGVLEDGYFKRVGGTSAVKVDARIVATVAADYEARIESGDLVLTWEAGQNSALDTRSIPEGRDVGNVVVQRQGSDGQEDVPYDTTFAFVFHAFRPDGTLHID